MSKRIGKSAKGEEVDFDLLETKQKMENNKPRAMEVKQREDFVHTKRRSRGRRAVMQRLKEKKDAEARKETSKTKKKTSSVKKESPKSTSEKSSTKRTKKKTRKIVKDDN